MAKVFAVLDHKVGLYMQPFHMESEGQAIRSFTDAVNSGETIFHRHPGDFTLYCLGEFNDTSGEYFNDRKFVIEATAVFYRVARPEDDGQQIDIDEMIGEQHE